MGDIRVLIVDDHAIVRQGLRTIMQVLPGLAYAGEAANGHEALAQARTLRPDLVLMDLVMPELDGVAAIAAIKAEQPHLPIIALTTFAEHAHVLGAVQAGANGYLLKDIDMHELARAIQHVYRGQPYLHPEATRLLLQATANPEPQGERLTGREQEVLTHVASGLTNRQIAEALHISEKTVSVHISNLLGKLGLTSRTQAALYATRIGLVPPGELA